MKIWTLLFCFVFSILLSPHLFAQQPPVKVESWSQGGFNDWFTERSGLDETIKGETILFSGSTNIGKLLFTANSIFIVRPQRLTSEQKKEFKEYRESKELGLEVKDFESPEPFIHQIKLLNVSEEINVLGKSKLSHYNVVRNEIKLNYEKVIYQNIYPHIDMEFSLPQEGGLKYDIIVHPGGNTSNIEFSHDGSSLNLNNENLEIFSKGFAMVDQAPAAIDMESNEEVEISYQLDKNKISFEVGKYNPAHTLVIDPWITYTADSVEIPDLGDSLLLTPWFTHINVDDENNVYTIQHDIGTIYDGGFSYVLGVYRASLNKYDPTGALLWSNEMVEYIVSDLTINPFTHDSFLPNGRKYDSDGILTASAETDNLYENWTIVYDPCYDTIVRGHGICLGEDDVPVNYSFWDESFDERNDFDPIGCLYIFQESNVIAMDPMGGSVYFILNTFEPGGINSKGKLYKVGYTEDGMGDDPQWIVDTYSSKFAEFNTHDLLACSYSYLYAYSEDTLVKRDKNTGDLLGTVFVGALPDEYYGWIGDFEGFNPGYKGIAVDMCGNVYLGRSNHVDVYDSDLNFLSEISTATSLVTDLEIKRNTLFVGGERYLESIDIEEVLLNLEQTPDSCSMCIGTASVQGCSDLDSLTILWSDGQSTPVATDLCEGWYAVTISGGCFGEEVVDSIYVEAISPICGLSVSLGSDSICLGDCLDLLAETTSGTPPYTYEWSPDIPETDAMVTVCPTETTTYQVIVTDESGHKDTTMSTITVLELPEIDLGNDTIIYSCDEAPVTLILDANNDGATYEWQDGSTEQTLEVTETGLYWVRVFVGTCENVDSINVVFTEGFELEIISNEPTCFGLSDGSVTVNVTGILGDLTFVITDEDETLLNEDNSNTANVLGTGWYYIEVTNEAGCSEIDSIFLDHPAEMTLDMTTFNPLCNGFETGWARVDDVQNFTGDYDGISYFWSPNPSGNEGLGADSAWAMGAGGYTLTINDENGCSKTFDFTIGEPPAMEWVEQETIPAQCRLFGYQNGNGIVYGAANGGTGTIEYLWTNDADPTDFTDVTTWGGRNPGNYTLTATDENGCILIWNVALDSVSPIADFTVNSDQLNADCQGTAAVEVEFVNNSLYFADPNDPGADTTFFWNLDNPAAGWQISNDYFETFDTTYGPHLQTYIVDVCLVAINKNGCKDTLCKDLTIYQPIAFTEVNIFTPNGDGNNDVFTFEFTSASISEFQCVIVNRWGVIVSELTSITDGWDGTDRNGDKVKDGLYFYSYEAITDNKNLLKGHGNIQVLTGK
jgi:gliding motility-associated-like protein